MEKEEMIWVSKELATQFNELDSDVSKESLISKAIVDKNKDIEMEISLMEERMQVFKLMSLKHKQALQQIRNDEYEMLEPLWEDVQKIEPKILESAKNLKNKLYPLKQEVQEIKKLVSDVNSWEITKLTDLINIVSSLDKDKMEMLKILIDHKSKG